MCSANVSFNGSACGGDDQTAWPGALEDNAACLQQQNIFESLVSSLKSLVVQFQLYRHIVVGNGMNNNSTTEGR